jgi:uncharacterized protein (DUF1778 family)
MMPAKDSNAKSARFDTRLSKDQKILFERAASLGGYRNLTDFVIAALQEKANQIIADQERIIASQKDSKIFFDAIINPPKPNKNLVDAAREYRALSVE